MRLGRFLAAYWQLILGLVLVTEFIVVAITAPWIAPKPAEVITPGNEGTVYSKEKIPLPPSAELPLGSIPASFNRHLDVFYVLVWGTRSALVFGLMVAIGSALIGILVGAASATLGGFAGQVLIRITDAFLAFPVVVGVVFFDQMLTLLTSDENVEFWVVNGVTLQFGQYSLQQIIIRQIDPVLLALILFSWMPYARLTHGMALKTQQAEFIQAARALGASGGRILARHLIPNSISPSIILAARDIGIAVILQASFTFVGLGTGSLWGQSLSTARRWVIGPGGDLLSRWWVFFPITLAIILFGISWNLLGDGLNDLLNPRKQ